MMVPGSYQWFFPPLFPNYALQRFSMLCLKCSVNVTMYVGNPEYLGVALVMLISCPSPCSHPCYFSFRQKLPLWLQERLQAWVFWIVLLMWCGCRVVVNQSFTEGLSCSTSQGIRDKTVSRSVKSSCLCRAFILSCVWAGSMNKYSQVIKCL